jgi:hypothetical protein
MDAPYVSMSHQYTNDECNECGNYAKLLQNEEIWKCEICLLVEQPIHISDKEVITWARMEVPCGHQMHIRCFRKWCKQHGIGCIHCGLIEQKETNQYCVICNAYGHPTCKK